MLGGDWNAHLLNPRPYHWADQAMTRAHADLALHGFASFPTSTTLPTYRSSSVSSTIDYIYYRNLRVEECEVARVFIAQHRPLAAVISLHNGDFAPPNALETAYG
jgi:endonuclease/exonuclease/phosphatase (EEP) superfamily protein YafD